MIKFGFCFKAFACFFLFSEQSAASLVHVQVKNTPQAFQTICWVSFTWSTAFLPWLENCLH